MEYVPGGDFRTLLNNSGVLKVRLGLAYESTQKFSYANVVVALQ